MAKKNITIDELAVMIQKGFNGVDSKFEQVGKRFDGLEKDIKEIKYDLKETIKRTDKLEVRADYVENVLAIKKI